MAHSTLQMSVSDRGECPDASADHRQVRPHLRHRLENRAQQRLREKPAHSEGKWPRISFDITSNCRAAVVAQRKLHQCQFHGNG